MGKKYNEVECFMYYMYNVWCLKESIMLFGERLGSHIFNKWAGKCEYSLDRTMSWYGDLDKKCRDKIYERAIDFYNNN